MLLTLEATTLGFLIRDALVQVLCPAVKLWNTWQGQRAMREAVSLMGGYGITEDSPGFLMQKWIDTQLEATYEGPEAVQRRQLSVTMASPIFLKQLELWAKDFLKQSTNSSCKDLGLNIIAHASKVWLQAMHYTQKHQDAQGALYHSQRQGISFALADALTWVMASRYQALDVLRLIAQANNLAHLAEALPGTISYLSDLCQWQALRMAGEVLRITEEIILGTQATDDDQADRQAFIQSTADLRGQLTGARAALTRAGEHLAAVTVAAALDYPQA